MPMQLQWYQRCGRDCSGIGHFSDANGNYSFSTINGYYAKDDFDPTAALTATMVL